MKKLYAVLVLVLAIPLLLLTGCGSGSPAPAGSTIAINIDKVDWTITGGACVGAWEYHVVYISVIGPNGRPVQNADIYVSLDLSVGTSSPVVDVNRLFDDQDWVDGVYAGPPSLSRWVQIGSYPTNTGTTGTKALIVGTDLSCEHKGNLEVHSGAAYGSISIDVHV